MMKCENSKIGKDEKPGFKSPLYVLPTMRSYLLFSSQLPESGGDSLIQ